MDAITLTELDQAAPEATGDTGLRVDTITDLAALDALQADWESLQGRSGPSAVFQSHAHIRIWARHFAPGTRGHGRLHIAVARENGRAVLILPLMIAGMPGLRVARMAGDPIAQYSELLVDPSGHVQRAFDAVLASLRFAGVDAIVFRRVREDSHLLQLARPLLRPPVSPQVAPFADLSSFADYPVFLKSLTHKARHALRHRLRKLEQFGGGRFELFKGGPEARETLAHALDLKRKWLIHHGAVSSAFIDTATKECLLNLAEDATTGCVVARLDVRGATAAIRFGFEYQGTHFTYLSAYDQGLMHLAPGKLSMDLLVAGFKERALQRIDMLPPTGQDKSELCHSEIGTADYTLPLSGVGRAYAALYRERGRLALQWTWQHLPASLRSLLATLLLRL